MTCAGGSNRVHNSECTHATPSSNFAVLPCFGGVTAPRLPQRQHALCPSTYSPTMSTATLSTYVLQIMQHHDSSSDRVHNHNIYAAPFYSATSLRGSWSIKTAAAAAVTLPQRILTRSIDRSSTLASMCYAHQNSTSLRENQ